MLITALVSCWDDDVRIVPYLRKSFPGVAALRSEVLMTYDTWGLIFKTS